MRTLAVVACALVLAAPAAAAPDWAANVEAATTYAKSRSGQESFAVTEQGGRLRGRLFHRHMTSASVIKAMLLVAYLRQPSVRGRALTRSERDLLEPMIRVSANDPASTIFNRLGTAGVSAFAKQAGMRSFRVSTHWGLSELTARDQARFFRKIDLLVPKRHRAYARRLLATVVSSQRWGIPPAAPKGWELFFKGGWLPRSDGWVLNQVALLKKGERRISIAILTRGNPSEVVRPGNAARHRQAAPSRRELSLSSRLRSVKIAHRSGVEHEGGRDGERF